MWEALFGQVKGVLGKAYVFSGLLPAALLFWGWEVFSAGAADFERRVAELLDKKEAAAAAVGLSGLKLFWLGLFFFAARGLILHALRAAPGALLTPVRWRLINRQSRRRWKADRRRQDCLWERTAFGWLARGGVLPHGENTYIPEWRRIPNGRASGSALRRCERARNLVLRLARRADSARLPSRRQFRRIACGLCNLYELTFNRPLNDRAYFEVSRWREMGTDARARRIMTLAEEDVHRTWLAARSQYQSFPEEKWLEPTSLGNRLASLDDYAEKRYGITTSTLWRRLVGIISKEERQEIADAQLTIESLSNLCVAGAALCAAVLVASAPESARALGSGSWEVKWRAVYFVAASLALSAASYYGAVYASGALCENVMRLVDLNRLKLITAMGLKSPRTVGEERALLEELTKLFVNGTRLKAERELEPHKEPKGESAANNGHRKPLVEMAAAPPGEESQAGAI